MFLFKGFKRRFYQGNNSHRGTEDRLGRVVTLIEDENEVTWGKAFQLDDEKASRSYLDNREVQLGGYTTILTEFVPIDKNVKPFNVLIYIALENNEQYLGKASYDEMALDIIQSKGHAGHNLEYLAKLAQFMREYLPMVQDDHLYLLEQLCIFILKSLNSSLLSYFYSDSVEEKWLSKIQYELINGSANLLNLNKNLNKLNENHNLDRNLDSDNEETEYDLKNAHSLEVTNSFDHSDSEESDSSESSLSEPTPCLCLTKSGCCDLMNCDNTELFDGNLSINTLMNINCLYNTELSISTNKQPTITLPKTKDQYRSKKNSFSDFSNHHSNKLFIKSY